MNMRVVTFGAAVAAFVAFALPVAQAQDTTDTALQKIIESSSRSPSSVARDPYRHPYEVLKFFGLRDDMTVVEILPGGATAYWTEILAPYLREKGKYIAAIGDNEAASDERRQMNTAFRAKLIADPHLYDRVQVNLFGSSRYDVAPANSADMVLTFRNVHNWMADGTADAMFQSFFKVLKPGGILGVEEHRANDDQPQDPQAKSGYVRQDYIIALAEKAGFQFAGSSEINANPKDTKDYPGGVWTLPPNYKQGDHERAKFAAIGESDRSILKFVKPQ